MLVVFANTISGTLPGSSASMFGVVSARVDRNVGRGDEDDDHVGDDEEVRGHL
jgi:hypothetical protein